VCFGASCFVDCGTARSILTQRAAVSQVTVAQDYNVQYYPDYKVRAPGHRLHWTWHLCRHVCLMGVPVSRHFTASRCTMPLSRTSPPRTRTSEFYAALTVPDSAARQLLLCCVARCVLRPRATPKPAQPSRSTEMQANPSHQCRQDGSCIFPAAWCQGDGQLTVTLALPRRQTVTNSLVNNTYLLYQCGTLPPAGLNGAPNAFQIPLTSVSVPDTVPYAFLVSPSCAARCDRGRAVAPAQGLAQASSQAV